MPKRSAIQVGDTQVEVPLPGGEPLRVRPQIVHEMGERYAGFADAESLMQGGIGHRVSVVLNRDEVEDTLSEHGGDSAEAAWRSLEAYATERTREQFEKGGLVVAVLRAEEFPSRIRSDLGLSWFLWLDAIDSDTAVAGTVADEIQEAGESFALLDGSLFYIRGLSVHPAFGGQQLGARLIAHALWAMQRCTGDTAVLLAKPTENYFTAGEPACGVREIRRLVRYYERMGFIRADRAERIRAGEAVAMYALFGEHRLPFRGLGELGFD